MTAQVPSFDLTSVEPGALALGLADLHEAHAVGQRLTIALRPPSVENAPTATDLLVGGGFEVAHPPRRVAGGEARRATVRRGRTLADTAAPELRLLVVGLNPSVYSADAGVPFARPGNRFWPAALAAGIVSADRDPRHALVADRVGLTDLVKRATPRADALTVDEYRLGLARVSRLVGWLRPGAVCFVGLTGWRAAADRRAVAGWQPATVGGTPVYVMPSTSGLNARTTPAELAAHLRVAGTPPDRRA